MLANCSQVRYGFINWHEKVDEKLGENSSYCRQLFVTVFANCFCAVHTLQLEFAITSLPTLALASKQHPSLISSTRKIQKRKRSLRTHKYEVRTYFFISMGNHFFSLWCCALAPSAHWSSTIIKYNNLNKMKTWIFLGGEIQHWGSLYLLSELDKTLHGRL